MIDFIRADFYRLIHSKGFWITEFALFCVILWEPYFNQISVLEQIFPTTKPLLKPWEN